MLDRSGRGAPVSKLVKQKSERSREMLEIDFHLRLTRRPKTKKITVQVDTEQ